VRFVVESPKSQTETISDSCNRAFAETTIQL